MPKQEKSTNVDDEGVGQMTTWNLGHFVWRELMTKDVDKAKGFYGELMGWSFEDTPMEGFTYTLVKLGEKMVAGMMPMQGDEHPPHWMSYVSVADVDGAAAAAQKAGGQVPVGPMDIPNVGRFAVIGDPAGAYFSLLRATDGDMPVDRPGVGEFCWETLSTTDVDGAFDFYATVCGWQPTEGPGGMKVFSAGEMPVADPQPAQPGVPPHWLTYVVVPGGADAGRERAVKLGATVVVPRIEVPGVGTIALVADPTGAVLGLFEPGQML
ncbi:MAG: VOC family protein [Polyangiales bacterium]